MMIQTENTATQTLYFCDKSCSVRQKLNHDHIQLKNNQDLNALGLNFDERLLHTTKKRNNQYCLGSGINQAQNYFFAKENTSSISWARLDV